MTTTATQLRIEQLDDLPAANPEWARLGLECGNPFTTWEWASSWWRQFGEGRKQLILGCRGANGKLVGIVPLYFSSRRPLRILRFVGHGPADQLGPVCAPGDREAVADALSCALKEHRDWDVLVAERLAVLDSWPELLGGTQTRHEQSLAVRPGASDWEEYLASRSSNFRQQVRRFERNLARDHEINLRLASDPQRLEEDMDTFLALHETRWNMESTAFSGPLTAFHRELAKLALEAGWLRLSILELDGEPCAATYVFRLGGCDWFYQSGRNPDMASNRVGRVLLNNAIRDTIRDGLTEFKFLTGDEDYKERYTDFDAPVETVALGRTSALRAGIATAIRLKRLIRRVRAAVPRRGA